MTNSSRFVCVLAVLALPVLANAGVVTYEVTYEGGVELFPDELPEVIRWVPEDPIECDRSIQDGWLVQDCDLGGWPEPMGERDFYRRDLPEFEGEAAFFVEWRVQTNIPRDIFDDGGIATVLSVSGGGNALYHFMITDDLVRLFRSWSLPIVFVDIEPGVPHTYRLELYEDGPDELYAWYVDGVLVDVDVQWGEYPRFDSTIVWGARRDFYQNTTRWDYVRYGTTPLPGEGDYDSDFDVDADDYYFFMQYFSGDGIDAGPGGRFADFDGDADVDCDDWLKFASRWRRTEADPADAAPAECRPPAESLTKAVDDRSPFSSFHRP